MEKLKKKYGLPVAIAMVVGVVIGSGVFYKTDDVLTSTNGNVLLALLAWGLGAFAMIFGALTFAEFAMRYETSNGIVDYFEVAYGRKVGYLVGWFKGLLYYSPLSAILAWLGGNFTMILLGKENPDNDPMTWILSAIYMTAVYLLNYYAPYLSGRLQVATTVIKLIPLLLVAVVGIIFGLVNQISIASFAESGRHFLAETQNTLHNGMLPLAVVSTAFAYEGWIVALSINNEIRDSKKNLPKALTLGAFIVFLVYVLYFLGITSVLPVSRILEEGNASVASVTNTLFGPVASTLLVVFIVISVLGTLNGLVIACIRSPFSLAVRGQGPMPKILGHINAKTTMPPYAGIYGYVISLLFLALWYGSFNNWYGTFISIDEIPIVMIYGFYFLLYIWYMIKFKDLSFRKRFIRPFFASIGAFIILYGGATNPKIGVYMMISLAVCLAGLIFYRKEVPVSKK